MDMTIVTTLVIAVVISIVLFGIMLFFIFKSNKNKLKENIDKVNYEKNLIDGSSIVSELSKIEAFLNNDKMQQKYDDWKHRLDVLRSDRVPVLNDMILDTEYSLSKSDRKNTIHKLAKLELELYKVRANSDLLLKEIKEITTNDEKNRAIITGLKTKYRTLYDKFNTIKSDYKDLAKVINLQFENIAYRFDDFERAMEQNEYQEVNQIIKAIDDLLKHMNIVIEQVPTILLLAVTVIPKKIEEIMSQYEEMKAENYSLDYLNIDYNVSETRKKIKDILDRSHVLDLEDSLFELKLLLDYFEGIFVDFDKERIHRKNYEENIKTFENRLFKINKLINDLIYQMSDIKQLYNLSDSDIRILNDAKEEVNVLNDDYSIFKTHTKNNSFAFSKISVEIENLLLRLTTLEDHLTSSLEAIGSMKEDEKRARQQLEEVKQIFKDSKNKIREYNLPIIPKNYYTELNDAQDAIKEINRELEKTPITISVLNTRVDTARDLVLKLFANTKSMLKSAIFAEMAIVYGNRYRTMYEDVDKGLNYAELLFYKGDYQKSLDVTISSINKFEPGIYQKLLDIYQK
jgi:septation ring formation regulator